MRSLQTFNRNDMYKYEIYESDGKCFTGVIMYYENNNF